MTFNKKYLNCPNCGAVITGKKCEYCGTVFDSTEEKSDCIKFGMSFEEAVEAFSRFSKIIGG